MSTAVESTALAVREEQTHELQPAAGEAAAQHEIQSAIIVARRFPRNEDAAFERLMRSCKRPSFAADVAYSFPRGGSTVTGPSVYLAREFARVWGNIRHGAHVVSDDDERRTIRAFAWDLETNTKCESEVTFKKLVQRKQWENGQKVTRWVEPDERDLRELSNKHAAICKRNCLLELLPPDMVDDALRQADETLQSSAAEDPDATRKAVIKAFTGVGVSVENLEAYLGHKLQQSQPSELVELRKLYKSIKDGSTTWVEIAAAKAASATKADGLAEKLKGKKKPESPEASAPTAERLPGQEG